MTEEMDDLGKTPEITDDDKLWSLLSYIIPLIAIIMLVMEEKKNRPFIKHNAINSLMLAVITVVLGIIPFVQCVSPLVWFYGIYLGIQAYQGNWPEVPGLTNFAKGQGWI